MLNQADQEKEHFEPQKQKGFSDLVAHNIKENKDDDSEGENGLFHLQGISRLNHFENIQEANEESGSGSSKENFLQRHAQTSLMEKFRDPKSSISSEDYKSEIV